jgi:hypothetical protein
VDQKPAAVTTTNDKHDSSNHKNLTMERQPGDDDAAAAFRLLLATSNAGTCDDGTKKNEIDHAGIALRGAQRGKFGTVLQGSSIDPNAEKEKLKDRRTAIEKQSALERAVGAKTGTNNLSLEEQIQRFPVLANAPRAKGMTATDVGVTFKPLGTQIRNVKCMACGIWGHSKGDRECRVSGWDPFAVTSVTNTATAAEGNDSSSNPEKNPRNHSSCHENAQDSMSSSAHSHNSSSTDSSSYERRKRRKKKDKKRRKNKKRSRSDAYDDDEKDERKRHRRRRTREEDEDENSVQHQRKKSHKKT